MSGEELSDFTDVYSNNEQYNYKFNLLPPYYTSDKWTNKLKKKVVSLAKAYNEFYDKIEQGYIPNIKKNSKIKHFFPNKTANNFAKHDNLFLKSNNMKNAANKTSSYFMNRNNLNKYINPNDGLDNNEQNNNLNELLPPVTNFNWNFEKNNFSNDILDSYLSSNQGRLFCISAVRRNQNTTMKKFYKVKKNDSFSFKNLENQKNLFSGRAQNEYINKFINDCQSKNRIRFFKKNDYRPKFNYSEPKDRRQISALKDIRKKQYLDYIKIKSEDNYMKFYYK